MTKDNGVEEIRVLIDRRSAAVRARDAEKSAAQSGPDVLAFDVIDPLQYRGREVVKKRAQEWFSSFDGAIEFEMRDVTIAASGDVGFSHSLNRVSGTRLDGNKLEMWWRSTACYRKVDGQWWVTHEHNSVPLNVSTGRASMDLQP